MAIISADTFRPLKRHIGVRLQQGVPIVDADWNEHEDIRRFELRSFLKWFVGDGIPEGTDGFRIIGQGLANDFLISAGPAPTVLAPDPTDHALRDIGRLLVDGRDILIDADIRFRQQPLHVSQPGSAALAAAWGVPIVPELPSLDGDLLIYVDIWDRLLTPAEDPTLVFSGLGTESCARLRREWVVRARNSTDVPKLTAPADSDFLAGHSYCALARVLRRTTSPNVVSSDPIDLRTRRLFVPPASLVEDVLGTTQERYRRGLDRPALSIRDAVNALLRGELPSTPDTPITLDPNTDSIRRAFAFDRSNGLLASWHSNRMGSINQVFISRLALSNILGGFDNVPVQVTSGTEHTFPSVAVLPNNEILVAYQNAVAGGDVFYKRGTYGTLAAAPELTVAATAALEASPEVVVSGNIAVFLLHSNSTNQWYFRRLRHTDNVWLDANPVVLSAQVTTVRDLHVAVAADTGRVWVAFRVANDLHALSLEPISGVVSNHTTAALDVGVATDSAPFILPTTSSGPVWVFWQSATVGLAMTRFAGGVWETPQTVPAAVASDRNPSAVLDAYGGIWLFFARGSPGRLYYVRREPSGGTWGQVRQLAYPPSGTATDTSPYVLLGPDRSTWVFWQSDRDGNLNAYFKQLITTI